MGPRFRADDEVSITLAGSTPWAANTLSNAFQPDRSVRYARPSVEPGKVYDFTIGVGQTSVVIAKGQRLRLQVSSSNFPQYDRNMNTGNGIGVDAKGVIAQQTIHHDRSRASYLELPMVQVRRS